MNEPKVFISYSWSSQAHKEMVRLLADRLIADGIDVILDIYDLNEGDDKYAFMESMVTDPSVTHVLVMCDLEYAQKANARKAGVGTESQIISGEVYDKVNQSKFIPIICEFDSEGEPVLPVFMKSRIWIDFSSPEAENENWERLIRLLYGKPLNVKPTKGKAPVYITSDVPIPINETSAKFKTLRQAILDQKKGIKVYRRDFIETCILYADKLRVRERPTAESLGEKVLDDCGKLKTVRNHLCDWVLLESELSEQVEFTDALIEVLEKLRELKSRPEELTSWNDAWFEAHSVFVYETFLYIVAALLKTGSYNVLHEIYSSHYILPLSDQHGQEKFGKFDCFYGHSESLQTILAPKGYTLHSPAAELLKRQSDREDIPFNDIMQAELLTLLMTSITPDAFWHPQTLYYSTYMNDYPFFTRAAQHKNFIKLSTITGIDSANDLRDKVKLGFEQMNVKNWYNFRLGANFWSLMNMEQLDTIK